MLIDNDLNGVQALLSSVWPEWKVTKQLGRGSYGYVYEIIRDDLGSVHKCALKVLQMDADLNLLSGTSPGQRGQLQTDAGIKKAAQGALSNESTDGAATTVAPPSTAQKAVLEGFVQGVSTEINLMLQLRGDPHVVSIEDYAILRDPRRYTILIRMEDLACVSKIAARDGGMDPGEVIRLGVDLCEALSHCEQENILHRDIKPSNIFYHSSAGYKLGDFGISRTMDFLYENMSMSSAGTPQYMAPEIYSGTKYDYTADIYSLGLTLYVLLNENRPPFLQADHEQSTPVQKTEKRHYANMRRLRGEPLPPPAHADERLYAVLSTACDPRPEYRFRSAEAFGRALRDCLGDDLIQEVGDTAGPLAAEKKDRDKSTGDSRSPFPHAALTAAVALIILFAGLSIGTVLFLRARTAEEPPEPLPWSDKKLEAAVLEQCGLAEDEVFTLARAKEITALKLDQLSLSDISSLQYFQNLTTLSLAGNHVSDLSPLSDLTGLTDLDLEGNNIKDLSPLGNLTALRSLNLAMNEIKDISSLAAADSLQTLDLRETKVSDLSALEKLPDLSSLDVRLCPIHDVSCIHRMKNKNTLKLISAEPYMEIPDDALFIEGHSYYLFDSNCADWDEVLAFCHAKGGYPAVINTYDENEALYRYMLQMEKTAVLFGYTDRESEGTWVWESRKSSLFTDWGENDEGQKEPNCATQDEDYAQLDVHMMKGHWNDCGFGHDTTAFICEWDGFQ